jgi:hypothetical protein
MHSIPPYTLCPKYIRIYIFLAIYSRENLKFANLLESVRHVCTILTRSGGVQDEALPWHLPGSSEENHENR